MEVNLTPTPKKSKIKLPHCKRPCNNCPFRLDSQKGWLGEERIKEILDTDSFVCHKSLSDAGNIHANSKQCAGFMILKDKYDESAFMNMARRLRIPLKLTGSNLVFENKKQCINHHKNIKNGNNR